MLPEETHCSFRKHPPFHNFPQNTLPFTFVHTLPYNKHKHLKHKQTDWDSQTASFLITGFFSQHQKKINPALLGMPTYYFK